MNWLDAVLLGVVEGLTEFLPVSSTGHLILVGHWLGLEGEAVHAFDVVVQAGALLAVVVHYRALLAARARGLLAGERRGVGLAKALLVAFVPAAVLGLLTHKAIERFLFGPVTVAAALVVGGVVMIVVERWLARSAGAARGASRVRGKGGVESVDDVTVRHATWVGLGQCASLWPGASRSMTTIVAGQLAGLPTAVAAEFSFLLALPTVGAATAFKALSSWRVLIGVGAAPLAIGLTVSFLVAWGVIAAFLRFLTRFGLTAFGVYRIALGALVFWGAAR